MDKHKVMQLCPSWQRPMSEGIPCTVFRRELEEQCPDLPAFLSKAGNQSHDVHSKETKVQLMLSLHQLALAKRQRSAASAKTDEAASAVWDCVVKEIETMKPQLKGKRAEAAHFASRRSGGDDATYLKES